MKEKKQIDTDNTLYNNRQQNKPTYMYQQKNKITNSNNNMQSNHK